MPSHGPTRAVTTGNAEARGRAAVIGTASAPVWSRRRRIQAPRMTGRTMTGTFPARKFSRSLLPGRRGSWGMRPSRRNPGTLDDQRCCNGIRPGVLRAGTRLSAGADAGPGAQARGSPRVSFRPDPLPKGAASSIRSSRAQADATVTGCGQALDALRIRQPSRATMPAAESAGQSRHRKRCRGKSGLHRARCQVTPGRREPTESATERYRLCRSDPAGKGEMVR